jgi:hypothetical protein
MVDDLSRGDRRSSIRPIERRAHVRHDDTGHQEVDLAGRGGGEVESVNMSPELVKNARFREFARPGPL